MRSIVSAEELLELLERDDVRLVDARFDLTDPAAGRRAYRAGHLPGAIYLSLDENLSASVRLDGIGGRHPLPDPYEFAQALGRAGIGSAHQVIAYDAEGSAFAARVWWMLRWIGHDQARVLDGGVAAWKEAGGVLARQTPGWPPTRMDAHPRPHMTVDAGEVARRLEDPSTLLIDARAVERYRGEIEPLDRKAGHLPGAWNLPYQGNLDDGRFLSTEALQARYADAGEADEVIVYCGSGVTAAHAALAMEAAGHRLPRLYPGSWSDWSSRPDVPVAVGDETGSYRPHGDRR